MKTGSIFLAARYAAAYDGLAKTNDEARRNLLAYQNALAALQDTGEYIINPTVPFSVKERLLTKILGPAASGAAVVFIKLLAKQKRFALAPEIDAALRELLDRRLGVKRAQITTAGEPQMRDKLEAALSKYFKAEIIASYAQDDKLLAGLVIRQRDTYIDASALARLRQLNKEITDGNKT